jgi:hypothetical protein
MPTLNMKTRVTNADVAVTAAPANASLFAPRRFSQTDIQTVSRPPYGDAPYGVTPGSWTALNSWASARASAESTLDGDVNYWDR